MPYQADIYRVMLASPSDVKEEHALFSSIVDTWNALHSANERAVILPIKWETHSTPEMGSRPQAIINKQLVHDSDILVGVFWTKLGTPTGASASGSVEEIEEFLANQKPVLLYFSNAPVVASSINVDQYQLLKDYRDKCFAEGLVATYDSVQEFRDLLLRHLLETVRRLKGEEPISRTSEGETLLEQNPEIRLNFEYSRTREYYDLQEYELRVTLSNESQQTISNYRLDIEFPRAFLNRSTFYALERTERSTDKFKFFRVTQEHHRNDPLYPGDSYMVFMSGYSIDDKMRDSGALNDHLKMTVYINALEVKTIDIPMRDLVDTPGWHHRSF